MPLFYGGRGQAERDDRNRHLVPGLRDTCQSDARGLISKKNNRTPLDARQQPRYAL